MIDGTIIRVHQQGTGARGGSSSGDRPVARRPDNQDCRAGRCARQSRPLHSPAWQRHDLVGVAPLIENVEFDMFLADKAFDSFGRGTRLDRCASGKLTSTGFLLVMLSFSVRVHLPPELSQVPYLSIRLQLLNGAPERPTEAERRSRREWQRPNSD